MLHWNPISINYLIELILVLIVAAFFIAQLKTSKNGKTKVYLALPLTVTFVGLALNVFPQLLKHSLHPDLATFTLPWPSVGGSIAMLGFVQFAQQFSLSSYKRKTSDLLVLILASSFLMLELGFAIARQLWMLEGFVEYRPGRMDIPFAIGFLYAIFRFFGHLVGALVRCC